MFKGMYGSKWIVHVIFAIFLVCAVVFTIIIVYEIDLTLSEIGEDTVIVTSNDIELCRFSLEELKAMPKMEFCDYINEKGKASVEVMFGGVLLCDVLAEQGLDISKYSTANFIGVDGYTSSSMIEEIIDRDKVYVVYEREGVLINPKSEGGTGPMEIVIAGEQFSIRNCKYLKEIELFRK